MSDVNPVDAAIAAARAAAPAANTNVPAVAPTAAAPTVVGRAAPLTLASLSSGGMSVDVFMKVNFFGITFDKDGTLLPEATVDIDLGKVAVCEAIKFGKNPVTYLKSYDQVTCASGGGWAAAITRAQQVEPSARPYMAVDIPMTNPDPIQLKDKAIPAGSKIGHTTSTTNKAHFQTLVDDVARAGYPENAKVRVKIGHEARDKNNNKWGLLTFNLLGLSADFATKAAA